MRRKRAGSSSSNANDHTKTDFWQFKGGKIKLDKTKTTATKSAKYAYNSAFGSISVSNGKHIWKLEVIRLTKKMCVGVTSSIKTLDMNFHKQDTYPHFGYTSGAMKISQNTQYEKYGINMKSGQIITIILDLNYRYISFMNNNDDLGIAFKRIEIGPNINYRLAVSLLDKNDSIKIIGYGEFFDGDADDDEDGDDKQEEYNEWDIKEIKSWNDIMVKQFIKKTLITKTSIHDGNDLNEIYYEINQKETHKNTQSLTKKINKCKQHIFVLKDEMISKAKGFEQEMNDFNISVSRKIKALTEDNQQQLIQQKNEYNRKSQQNQVRINKFKIEFEREREQNAKLLAEINKYKLAKEQLLNGYNQLTGKINESNIQIVTLTKQNQELAKNYCTKNKYELLLNTYNVHVKQLEDEIESNKNEKSQLRKQLKLKQNDMKKLSKQNEELIEAKDEFESTNSQILDKYIGIQKEKNALIADNDELIDKHKNERRLMETQTKKYNQLLQNISALTVEKNENENTIKNMAEISTKEKNEFLKQTNEMEEKLNNFELINEELKENEKCIKIELESERKRFNMAMDKIKQENIDKLQVLTEQNKEAKNKLNKSLENEKCATMGLEKKNNEYNQIEKEKKKYEAINKKLNTKSQEYCIEINEINQENNELREKINKCLELEKQSKQILNESDIKNDDLLNKIKQENATNAKAYNDKVQLLTNENKALLQKYNELAQKLKDKIEELNESLKVNKTIQNELEIQNKKNSELIQTEQRWTKKEINNAQKMQTLTKQNQELIQQQNENDNENRELKQKLNENESINKQLTEKITKCNAKIESLTENVEKQCNVLEKQKNEWRQKNEELITEKTKCKQLTEELHKSLENEKKQNEKSNQLFQQNNNLKATNQELKNKNDELLNQIKQEKDTNIERYNEKQELIEKMNGFTVQNKELLNKNNQMNKNKNELTNKIEELTDNLHGSQKEAEMQRKENSELIHKNNELIEHKNKIEIKIKDKDSALNDLRKEKKTVTQQLNQLVENEKIIKYELNENKVRNDALSETLEEYETKLNNLKQENVDKNEQNIQHLIDYNKKIELLTKENRELMETKNIIDENHELLTQELNKTMENEQCIKNKHERLLDKYKNDIKKLSNAKEQNELLDKCIAIQKEKNDEVTRKHKNEMQVMTKNNDNQQNDINEKLHKIQELECTIKELLNEKNELIQISKEYKTKSDEDLSNIKQENVDKNNKIELLTKQINESMKNEKLIQNEHHTKLKQLEKEYKENSDLLQKENNDLNSEINEFKTEINKNMADISDLKSQQNQTVINLKDEFNQKLMNKKKQFNNENIFEIKKLLNEQKDTNNKIYYNALADVLKESELKQDEYTDITAERDELKLKNSKIKKKLKTANKEKDGLLVLYDRKEKEIEIVKMENEKLDREVEIGKTENKKLRKQLKKLKQNRHNSLRDKKKASIQSMDE